MASEAWRAGRTVRFDNLRCSQHDGARIIVAVEANVGAGPVRIETTSVEETQASGRRLGAVLRAGDVVGLIGPLGAGKTMFVKGAAEGAGVVDTRRVASPTFVLVREYEGRLHLYHLDLYRLERTREAVELGIEEMRADGGVILVEWADRLPRALPDDRLTVTIEPTGLTTRSLTFAASGVDSAALAGRFGQAFQAQQ